MHQKKARGILLKQNNWGTVDPPGKQFVHKYVGVDGNKTCIVICEDFRVENGTFPGTQQQP